MTFPKKYKWKRTLEATLKINLQHICLGSEAYKRTLKKIKPKKQIVARITELVMSVKKESSEEEMLEF